MNQNDANYRWRTGKDVGPSGPRTVRFPMGTPSCHSSGNQLNQLLLSLRELIEWVIKKRTELTSMSSIGGDVSTISKQLEELTLFRMSLEEERPVIETTLMSGRSYLSKDDPQGLDYSEDEDRYRVNGGDEEVIRKTTRSIRREVKKLTEKWSELLQLTEQRQRRLDDILRKMITLQKQMDDLTGKLHMAEINKSKWLPLNDIILDRLSEQLSELQLFRDIIYNCQILVESMNDTASRITGSNVLLSHVNLNRLEELNTRWKLIQVAVDERRKGLEEAMKDSNSSVGQSFLNDNLEHPWERAVAPNKVPYYINHSNETTHWDHPKMIDLMNSLVEFNEIRYSAYRTAMKLRTIQRSLNIDYIHLGSLIKIFDGHGLHGQNDKLISVPEIINCLQTVYESTVTPSEAAPLIDIPLSINLCLNWLLNLYDTSNRTGLVRVFSFKIGLITLCKGALEDKYRFMFRLIADVHGFADERKLGLLLHELIQVPRLLGEINAFGGPNIEPSVRSCFQLAGYKTDIDSTDFLVWLQREPQSTVWLPVFHRHKITHPMQEYCLTTSSGEEVRDFTRIICNKFKSKSHFERNYNKYSYLPVQSTNGIHHGELEGDCLDESSPMHNLTHQIPVDMHSKLELYANRLAEAELNNYSDQVNLDEQNDVDHQIMGQYCQPLSSDYAYNLNQCNPGQMMGPIETEDRKELESIIYSLEQENRLLQAEYERLKAGKNQEQQQHQQHHISNGKAYSMNHVDGLIGNDLAAYSSSNSSREEALIAEAKALRLRKDELETKKLLLEEQNKQLESTLKRLRQYLNGESDEMVTTNLHTIRSTGYPSFHRTSSTPRYYHNTHYNSSPYRSNHHYHHPPSPPSHHQSNPYLDEIR
uniref:WW domain-containing protein n=1 Tax=Tetranychus urticae TaxID=32264 RepID=T1KPK1_TETUR